MFWSTPRYEISYGSRAQSRSYCPHLEQPGRATLSKVPGPLLEAACFQEDREADVFFDNRECW
jgi:hypothetical protein